MTVVSLHDASLILCQWFYVHMKQIRDLKLADNGFSCQLHFLLGWSDLLQGLISHDQARCKVLRMCDLGVVFCAGDLVFWFVFRFPSSISVY